MDNTINYTLNLNPTFKEKTYVIVREEHHRFEGISNKNFTEANFKVKHVGVLKNKANRFEVSQYNYKQSNVSGMYKWAGNLHSLRNKVVVDVDVYGQIINVENHYLIKIFWEELQYDLKKQHKKDPYVHFMIKNITHIMGSKKNYLNAIKYSFPYSILFPLVYNKGLYTANGAKGYRELNGFIGTKSVPILTTEKLKESSINTNSKELQVIGEIDTANFKQNHISEMIKTLKNRPRVPSQVKLNYIERYLLDTDDSPTQAMCLSLVQIPGTLYRYEKTIVKQLKVL